MTYKENRLQRKEERKEFKDELKIYLKINQLKQKHIAYDMGIEESEFHNMLCGFQSTIPAKDIFSWNQFKELVLENLGVDSLEV